MSQPDPLPRGLNFEDNRWLAHENSDEVGFCADCGDETKARVLAFNGIHSGHKVCYRCLKRRRDGAPMTIDEELSSNTPIQEISDESLPF